MLAKLNITQKGLILVLVPLVLELAFVITLACLLKSADEQLLSIDHCAAALQTWHRYTSKFMLAMLAMNDIKTKSREEQVRFLDKLMTGEGYPADGHYLFDPQEFPEIKDLIYEARSMNDVIHVNFKHIRKQLLDPEMKDIDRRGLFSRNEMSYQMAAALEQLDRRFITEETRIGKSAPQEIERIRRVLFFVLAIGLFISCTFSVVLSLLFSRQIERRLSELQEKATLLSTGKELMLAEDFSDELGALEKALRTTSIAMAESRRKELAVLENSADILCSIDTNLRFIDVGESCSKLWKRPASDLAGASIFSIVSDDTADATRAAFVLGASLGEQSHEGSAENVILCGDGSRRNCLWRTVYSLEGNCYYCVIHDVTELRAAENLKRMFLSMVSHDLRAPLQSIGLSLSALLEGRRGELPASVRQTLERAQAANGNVAQLANTLLTFEKLTSMKPNLRLEPLSAAEICEQAIAAVATAAARSQVEIAEPSGDGAVLADEQRLIQCLTTILSNAVRCSPPLSTVTVRVFARSGQIEFRISHDKSAISEQERATISALLTESTAGAVPAIRGSGLAFSIARAIILAHQGVIGLEVEADGRVCIWFSIPELEGDEP